MQRWEYIVETINTEYVPDKEGNIDNAPSGEQILSQSLNYNGAEGWEIVGFLPALPARHFKGSPPNPFLFYAIYKRLSAD